MDGKPEVFNINYIPKMTIARAYVTKRKKNHTPKP